MFPPEQWGADTRSDLRLIICNCSAVYCEKQLWSCQRDFMNLEHQVVCFLDNGEVSSSWHSLKAKGQATHTQTHTVIYENSWEEIEMRGLWREEEQGCLFCCAACFSVFSFKGRKRSWEEEGERGRNKHKEREREREWASQRNTLSVQTMQLPSGLHSQVHVEKKCRLL